MWCDGLNIQLLISLKQCSDFDNLPGIKRGKFLPYADRRREENQMRIKKGNLR